MDERSGFYVMTPLRLPDGTAVLVQRGWVPRDDTDPMRVPVLPMLAGQQRVYGHAAPWPSHWIDIGHGAGGAVRQNLELAAFTAESGLALRPVMLVEDITPANALDGMRRDWPTGDGGVSVTTNYGYAVQWFAMSIAFLGLWVWAAVHPPRAAWPRPPIPISRTTPASTTPPPDETDAVRRSRGHRPRIPHVHAARHARPRCATTRPRRAGAAASRCW